MPDTHSDQFNLTTSSLGLFLLVILSAPAVAQTGVVAGRVLVDNGVAFESPNEGIRILFKGPYEMRVAMSEPDGTFRMSGLQPGRWLVYVSARGYKQSSRAVVLVNANMTNRVAPEPIILKRLKSRPAGPEPSGENGGVGPISGQVLVQNGKEVEPPKAKLRIRVVGAFEVRHIYTSADGRFLITGFRGRSKLKVSQRGFRQRDEAYADVGVPVTIIVERIVKN